MLANLDNEVYFRHVFSDSIVFNGFVQDILGIDATFSKIEPAKKFKPKVGYIDFELDLFAESDDERVIVEIQKIVYDYNFDRFLHYFMMSIGELQRTYKDYKIQKTVYGIILITEPYKILPNGNPIRDEVMITKLNPKNLKNQEIDLFGHQLVFLNPNYRNDQTPENIKDWLDLFYESIHNPANAVINQNNKAVQRAEQLGNKDKLSSTVVNKAKQKESAIIKAKLLKDEIEQQKKELQTKDKQLETKDKQLETKDKQLETKDKQLETERQKAETKDKQLMETIKLLKSLKIDNQTIAERTSLDISEIEKIN
jgi:hypothetical protein